MARKFSEEYRRKAVELYLARGKDLSVADELGIVDQRFKSGSASTEAS